MRGAEPLRLRRVSAWLLRMVLQWRANLQVGIVTPRKPTSSGRTALASLEVAAMNRPDLEVFPKTPSDLEVIPESPSDLEVNAGEKTNL